MSQTRPVVTSPTCHVALEPADWAVATWRPRTPLVRPPAPTFDRTSSLARLRRLLVSSNPYGIPEWGRAGLSDHLCIEEAHFWFLAMTDTTPAGPKSTLLVELQRADLAKPLDREAIRRRLRQRGGYLTEHVLIPLANLLAPTELLEVLLDDQMYAIDPARVPYFMVSALPGVLIEGFRRRVLPYLDEATLEPMRQLARARINPALWGQGPGPSLEQTIGYRLAPLLGMHRELRMLVSAWPDDLFPRRGSSHEEWRRSPRPMIFGLGDPCLVDQHVRRLGLLLRHEQEARHWLAHTETRGLDWLCASIRAMPQPSGQALIDVLCLVRAPEAARPLLELRLEGRSCPSLRNWFETQVGNAVAGLLPLAGGRGKLADAARDYLREVKRRGMAGVIEEGLQHVEPSVATRVRNSILDFEETQYPVLALDGLPTWLQQGLRSLPDLPAEEPFPDWLQSDDLPPLVVSGQRLGPGQVRTVLRLVRHCKFDQTPTLLRTLRTHVAAPFREAFAWALVAQWECVGGTQRDNWALKAVGFLGGDESVLELVGRIRDWTGVARRHRALLGLECLAAIGSSLALQQLTALARQLRSRILRLWARKQVEDSARTRGMNRSELEELSVPLLGFVGEKGPIFDFGSRSFQAILAPGGKLVLRDSSGAVRADLPAPGVKDDPGKARQAVSDWRLLRKTVREVLKDQTSRLERAMVSGQRWAIRHFRERILGQPLLWQLARLLVWGGYDDRGRLARTFRITEEGGFVDVEENKVSLADLNSIRIVHPVELPETRRQAWAEVWRDHELVAPFAQMGRRVFVLTDEERQARAVTAFRGRRVPALTLVGLLKGQDWEPVRVFKGNQGEAHRKEFRSWGVTGVLYHPNVGEYAYPDPRGEQELRAGYFVRTGDVTGNEIDPEAACPLGEVPDLPRSELCEMMALVFGKSRE